MMNLEDVKIGDSLYFHTDGGRTGKATVSHIYTDGLAQPAISMQTRHTSFTVQLRNLFATSEEVTRHIKEIHDERFNERLKKIRTVEDLVRFMYDNTVSEADEYTDEDGRKIAAMKAKELLGIDLDA